MPIDAVTVVTGRLANSSLVAASREAMTSTRRHAGQAVSSSRRDRPDAVRGFHCDRGWHDGAVPATTGAGCETRSSEGWNTTAATREPVSPGEGRKSNS